METITIVDTSISTDNTGDEIIMESVNEIISEIFSDSYIFRVSSHDALSERTRSFIRKSSWCFIGGTNLLSSDFKPWSLWKLDALAANALGSSRTICLGTGWNDYMLPPNEDSQKLLRTALSNKYIHAARDRYTQSHLESLGLASVFTSCPTTWALTPSVCSKIPARKSGTAIITLSAWRAEVELDRNWINIVKKSYEKVVFFSQMQEDFEYLQSIGFTDIPVVAATVQAYDRYLESNVVDFIGTRLHGGIRALQKGRRAVILSIDNRAAEMGKDTGLPVLPRADCMALSKWIGESSTVKLDLPYEAIERWKNQFTLSARQNLEPLYPLPEVIPPPPLMKRLKPALKMLIGRT